MNLRSINEKNPYCLLKEKDLFLSKAHAYGESKNMEKDTILVQSSV